MDKFIEHCQPPSAPPLEFDITPQRCNQHVFETLRATESLRAMETACVTGQGAPTGSFPKPGSLSHTMNIHTIVRVLYIKNTDLHKREMQT